MHNKITIYQAGYTYCMVYTRVITRMEMDNHKQHSNPNNDVYSKAVSVSAKIKKQTATKHELDTMVAAHIMPLT